MGKDSVLGHDPLGWMKIVKENKKSISLGGANAADQSTAKNDQQTNSRITVKQEKPLPPNIDNTQEAPKVLPSAGNTDKEMNNTAAPKPRIVIGRLYEKPTAEKGKSVERNEGSVRESKPYIEPSFPVSRTVQTIKKNEPEINRAHLSVPADRFSTYIIIAYTALMLILGYFVYNDLSKRTSRIEARLLAIEKSLRSKQH
ncbi:MAG: hypothetical protein HUU08_08785 [Candidatus Brocadia sp.]|nr:hypothetical protein [Candidatus Brocadia sp.]